MRGGRLDQVILNQIRARPYFLLVLTPGTLERCDCDLHPDQVRALAPYRRTVESQGQLPELRDLFRCHAWDDRRGVATKLNDLLEAEGVSVWFSEKDILLGQPFMREIDRGLAKSRAGLALITPALLERVTNRGVSDKELSELLARDQLIPCRA